MRKYTPAEVKIVKPTPEVVKKIKPAQKKPSVQISLFDENNEVTATPQPESSSKVVPITAPKMSLQERFIMCGQNGLRQPKKKLQQLHKILHETAIVHGDNAGFSLLNYAGQAIKNKNLGYGIKDFGYNHLRDFVADFPELYETTQDNTGQHFRYRCR